MLQQRPLDTHTHTHTDRHTHLVIYIHSCFLNRSLRISMDWYTVLYPDLAIFQKQCNVGQLLVDAIKTVINQIERKYSVYLPINIPLCPVAFCSSNISLERLILLWFSCIWKIHLQFRHGCLTPTCFTAPHTSGLTVLFYHPQQPSADRAEYSTCLQILRQNFKQVQWDLAIGQFQSDDWYCTIYSIVTTQNSIKLS